MIFQLPDLVHVIPPQDIPHTATYHLHLNLHPGEEIRQNKKKDKYSSTPLDL